MWSQIGEGGGWWFALILSQSSSPLASLVASSNSVVASVHQPTPLITTLLRGPRVGLSAILKPITHKESQRQLSPLLPIASCLAAADQLPLMTIHLSRALYLPEDLYHRGYYDS
jgi:hypothetical protein